MAKRGTSEEGEQVVLTGIMFRESKKEVGTSEPAKRRRERSGQFHSQNLRDTIQPNWFIWSISDISITAFKISMLMILNFSD